MKTMCLVKILWLSLALSGCATMIQRDGVPVEEHWMAEAEQDVLSRAAFDLNCPKANLLLTVVAARSSGIPTTIGVSGCDQRATYVRTSINSPWVLNTTGR